MLAKSIAAIFLAIFVLGVLGLGNQAIRVNQVARPEIPSPESPLDDALQLYQKYGIDPPGELVNAAAVAKREHRVKTTIKAWPQPHDNSYLLPVYVGNSNTPLWVLTDTESSDFWVLSDLQPTSETSGHGHKVYNTSSGAVESGETWGILYKDGSSAAGVVYADQVVIGKATATSQAIEAATSTSEEYRHYHREDGIIGLTFDDVNTCKPKKCKTFFTNIAASLAKPIFTIALGSRKPGAVTFGYLDKSLYTGSITYMPVDKSKHPGTPRGRYGIYPGAYSTGSQNQSLAGNFSQGDIVTLVDTGSTFMYVPVHIAEDYWSHVEGATNDNYWYYTCTSTLPDFNIDISGTVFTIPGPYVEYNALGNGTCWGGIQAIPGMKFSALGETFLRSVYAVFEPYGPRLGFAKQAGVMD